MIVFAHTPKCGGKSIYKALQENFKERVLLDQTDPYSINRLQLYYQKFYTKGYKSPTTFFDSYDCIYGHFSHDRYRGIRDGSCLGMLFRHPIDLVSSYYFYKVNKGIESAKKHNIKYVQRYPYGSVLELSSTYKFKNFFRLYLGDLDPSNLDFLFIQEYFSESIELFEKVTGLRINEYKENTTINKPNNYRNYLVDTEEFNTVENNMTSNIVIYNKAVDRFKSLCKKNGVKVD